MTSDEAGIRPCRRTWTRLKSLWDESDNTKIALVALILAILMAAAQFMRVFCAGTEELKQHNHELRQENVELKREVGELKFFLCETGAFDSVRFNCPGPTHNDVDFKLEE